MIRRLLDRLVVAWCRISGTHFIEPWIDIVDPSLRPALRAEAIDHKGCEDCTWCVECERLIGRPAIEGVPDAG